MWGKSRVSGESNRGRGSVGHRALVVVVVMMVMVGWLVGGACIYVCRQVGMSMRDCGMVRDVERRNGGGGGVR